ncbi:MAG: GIY-YIG nuclease family protein [Patescibacteria group bacterium]
MWTIYALYNQEAGKIYIGQTNNLKRRIFEHNQKRGNHFTAKAKGMWELIYREDCADKTSALIREKQLKSYQGRQFIKKLIPL